jgi:hypothetical protein
LFSNDVFAVRLQNTVDVSELLPSIEYNYGLKLNGSFQPLPQFVCKESVVTTGTTLCRIFSVRIGESGYLVSNVAFSDDLAGLRGGK